MSITRNRSQSQHGPQVQPRTLQQHLQGFQDVLSAFDGYQSSGPGLQSTVLQRPTGRQRLTVLQRLLDRGRRLVSAVAQLFRR
jgi:hypothetical protein